MLKYVDVIVGFAEIPNEISLCISISGCVMTCHNCHSSYLRKDIGEPLTNEVIDELIKKNEGITCICLMGGSNNLKALNLLMAHCKEKYPNLKRAVYLGNDCFPAMLNLHLYDYIKLGSYNEKLGGLNSPNTNQRMYKIENITSKFWRNETN